MLTVHILTIYDWSSMIIWSNNFTIKNQVKMRNHFDYNLDR